MTEDKRDVHSPVHAEAVTEEDRILPCIERLQRLEKLLDEINKKPAEIPLEKEQMLLQSMDRIKSVESDLKQTKKVRLGPFWWDVWRLEMFSYIYPGTYALEPERTPSIFIIFFIYIALIKLNQC